MLKEASCSNGNNLASSEFLMLEKHKSYDNNGIVTLTKSPPNIVAFKNTYAQKTFIIRNSTLGLALRIRRKCIPKLYDTNKILPTVSQIQHGSKCLCFNATEIDIMCLNNASNTLCNNDGYDPTQQHIVYHGYYEHSKLSWSRDYNTQKAVLVACLLCSCSCPKELTIHPNITQIFHQKTTLKHLNAFLNRITKNFVCEDLGSHICGFWWTLLPPAGGFVIGNRSTGRMFVFPNTEITLYSAIKTLQTGLLFLITATNENPLHYPHPRIITIQSETEHLSDDPLDYQTAQELMTSWVAESNQELSSFSLLEQNENKQEHSMPHAHKFKFRFNLDKYLGVNIEAIIDNTSSFRCQKRLEHYNYNPVISLPFPSARMLPIAAASTSVSTYDMIKNPLTYQHSGVGGFLRPLSLSQKNLRRMMLIAVWTIERLQDYGHSIVIRHPEIDMQQYLKLYTNILNLKNLEHQEKQMRLIKLSNAEEEEEEEEKEEEEGEKDEKKEIYQREEHKDAYSVSTDSKSLVLSHPCYYMLNKRNEHEKNKENQNGKTQYTAIVLFDADNKDVSTIINEAEANVLQLESTKLMPSYDKIFLHKKSQHIIHSCTDPGVASYEYSFLNPFLNIDINAVDSTINLVANLSFLNQTKDISTIECNELSPIKSTSSFKKFGKNLEEEKETTIPLKQKECAFQSDNKPSKDYEISDETMPYYNHSSVNSSTCHNSSSLLLVPSKHCLTRSNRAQTSCNFNKNRHSISRNSKSLPYRSTTLRQRYKRFLTQDFSEHISLETIMKGCELTMSEYNSPSHSQIDFSSSSSSVRSNVSNKFDNALPVQPLEIPKIQSISSSSFSHSLSPDAALSLPRALSFSSFQGISQNKNDGHDKSNNNNNVSVEHCEIENIVDVLLSSPVCTNTDDHKTNSCATIRQSTAIAAKTDTKSIVHHDIQCKNNHKVRKGNKEEEQQQHKAQISNMTSNLNETGSNTRNNLKIKDMPIIDIHNITATNHIDNAFESPIQELQCKNPAQCFSDFWIHHNHFFNSERDEKELHNTTAMLHNGINYIHNNNPSILIYDREDDDEEDIKNTHHSYKFLFKDHYMDHSPMNTMISPQLMIPDDQGAFINKSSERKSSLHTSHYRKSSMLHLSRLVAIKSYDDYHEALMNKLSKEAFSSFSLRNSECKNSFKTSVNLNQFLLDGGNRDNNNNNNDGDDNNNDDDETLFLKKREKLRKTSMKSKYFKKDLQQKISFNKDILCTKCDSCNDEFKQNTDRFKHYNSTTYSNKSNVRYNTNNNINENIMSNHYQQSKTSSTINNDDVIKTSSLNNNLNSKLSISNISNRNSSQTLRHIQKSKINYNNIKTKKHYNDYHTPINDYYYCLHHPKKKRQLTTYEGIEAHSKKHYCNHHYFVTPFNTSPLMEISYHDPYHKNHHLESLKKDRRGISYKSKSILNNRYFQQQKNCNCNRQHPFLIFEPTLSPLQQQPIVSTFTNKKRIIKRIQQKRKISPWFLRTTNMVIAMKKAKRNFCSSKFSNIFNHKISRHLYERQQLHQHYYLLPHYISIIIPNLIQHTSRISDILRN